MHSLKENKSHLNDETTSVQVSFNKDVRSLVKDMEELGNTFEEDGPDLVTLDNTECVGRPAIETIKKVIKIGLNQF